MRIVHIKNKYARRAVLVVYAALAGPVLGMLGMLDGFTTAYETIRDRFMPLWRGRE